LYALTICSGRPKSLLSISNPLFAADGCEDAASIGTGSTRCFLYGFSLLEFVPEFVPAGSGNSLAAALLYGFSLLEFVPAGSGNSLAAAFLYGVSLLGFVPAGSGNALAAAFLYGFSLPEFLPAGSGNSLAATFLYGITASLIGFTVATACNGGLVECKLSDDLVAAAAFSIWSRISIAASSKARSFGSSGTGG
jgi:hypothetical protein